MLETNWEILQKKLDFVISKNVKLRVGFTDRDVLDVEALRNDTLKTLLKNLNYSCSLDEAIHYMRSVSILDLYMSVSSIELLSDRPRTNIFLNGTSPIKQTGQDIPFLLNGEAQVTEIVFEITNDDSHHLINSLIKPAKIFTFTEGFTIDSFQFTIREEFVSNRHALAVDTIKRVSPHFYQVFQRELGPYIKTYVQNLQTLEEYSSSIPKFYNSILPYLSFSELMKSYKVEKIKSYILGL